MSRASRPVRRLRSEERASVVARVLVLLGWRSLGGTARDGEGLRGCALAYAADRLGVRPAPLRRCVLGRVVTTHAARRVLDAARAA